MGGTPPSPLPPRPLLLLRPSFRSLVVDELHLYKLFVYRKITTHSITQEVSGIQTMEFIYVLQFEIMVSVLAWYFRSHFQDISLKQLGQYLQKVLTAVAIQQKVAYRNSVIHFQLNLSGRTFSTVQNCNDFFRLCFLDFT